jgi:hypothetical protein
MRKISHHLGRRLLANVPGNRHFYAGSLAQSPGSLAEVRRPTGEVRQLLDCGDRDDAGERTAPDLDA